MCLDNSPHSLSGLRPEKHRGRASPSSPPPSPLAQPRPLRYACTPGASMRLSSPHSTIPTRPACQSRCGKSSRKSAAVCLQAGPGTQICDASQRVATAAKNTFVCCAAPEAWDPPSIKQNRRAHLRRALGEVDWATAACRVGPRTSGSAGAGSRPPRTPTRPRPASRSPPAIATAGGVQGFVSRRRRVRQVFLSCDRIAAALLSLHSITPWTSSPGRGQSPWSLSCRRRRVRNAKAIGSGMITDKADNDKAAKGT